jgi:hypothetical protein
MSRDAHLGFTVVQEFGSPYWTAEIRFQGENIMDYDPEMGGAFKIVDTDSITKERRIIFYGYPIKVHWEIKEGIVEYVVKAVTNGWFMTQQNVPEELASSGCTHFYTESFGSSKLKCWKYPRFNEIMMVWNYLQFTPGPVGNSEWVNEPERTSFCSYPSIIMNTSNVSSELASVTIGQMPGGGVIGGAIRDTGEGGVCNVWVSEDMYNSLDVGICDAYNMRWDWKDGLNKTGDERFEWVFDYQTTTKYDAIMQMADYCNRIFHWRLTQNDHDLKMDSGSYVPHEGEVVAYWTPNSSANANSVEPFSTLLTINAASDNALLKIEKNEKKIERTQPNCVYAYSLGPVNYWNRSGEPYEGVYPARWEELASGRNDAIWNEPQVPVIRYKNVKNLNENEIQDYAEAYYNRIRDEEGNKYTLDTVCTITTRGSPYDSVLPGSRIKITGIDPKLVDPNTEFRILKITHFREPAKPTVTTMEFAKVYDIAHPYKIDASALEEVMEAKIAPGAVSKVDDTYPYMAQTRHDSLGEVVYALPGEIMNVTNGLAEVRTLNSSTLIKDVIVFA